MKLAIALLLSACWLSAQPNALSSKEKAEGWVLLFDGKSLAGWDQGAGATWRALDGVLVAD